MTGASKEKTESIVRRRIGGTSIVNVLYSFAKKIGTVALVYLVGYFEFSVAWLIGPVILSVIRDEWKKDKELRRNVAKTLAVCNEEDFILARVQDLPSWVFFPDVERVEWLNRILRQVWPNINHYAKTILKETIEPNVRTSLQAYKLNGFRFERMILGSIPLRIGGVKVYDRNVSRNEILMDMDIFYAGECDISFTIGSIKGGIKDFQIHGMMRVVMKPLITSMPLIGGLQLFFLNNPTIDFNLVGMADLLDMPGLSDILRRIIVEQIANVMVLPNKLPITLSDDIPATVLKMPEPEGVLRVHVVEAKELMKMDIGVLRKGKSDPYAIITVGAQEFRTQTIDNTVNPKWDFWCEAVISSHEGQEVTMEVMDWDPGFPGVQNDDYLGRATVDVNSVAKNGQIDYWLTLEGVKSGMVHLRMTWLTLSSSLADLEAAIAETQLLRLTSMSTGLLMVFVDSAKSLPNARPTKKPDPFAQLSLGKQQEVTNVQLRTGDPVWEQGFTFLVNNPDSDTLRIKVIDQKTSQEMGYFVYNLKSLADKPYLRLDSQPYRLSQSGPDSKITISLEMRILKYEGPRKSDNEDDDEDEDGNNQVEPEEEAPLIRGGSVKKPDSPINTAPSEPNTPVRISKQESRDSVQSGSSSSIQQPVEEIMTLSKAPPGVDSPPPGDLRNRAPSMTSSAGEAGLGRIQLTLRYSIQRQRLVVVVHKVANLPLRDPANIPDPYVKLYLLPERAKDSKRKTETMKDNCNPVYDETFEYILSQGELNSRQLEVSVVTRKGWFSSQSPVMGQVVVNLGEQELSTAITCWFDLQPESPRDV